MPSISSTEKGTSTSSSTGMGLAREGQSGIATMALQLAREQRHEGRREGAFGEQATEEVRQLERHEEGVSQSARAQHRRQHDVADEAHDAAQQGEPADRGDSAAEAHGVTSGPRPSSRESARLRWVEPSECPPRAPLAVARSQHEIVACSTAIILSSSSDIVFLGGGRRCNGRYKPLPRPVPKKGRFFIVSPPGRAASRDPGRQASCSRRRSSRARRPAARFPRSKIPAARAARRCRA